MKLFVFCSLTYLAWCFSAYSEDTQRMLIIKALVAEVEKATGSHLDIPETKENSEEASEVENDQKQIKATDEVLLKPKKPSKPQTLIEKQKQWQQELVNDHKATLKAWHLESQMILKEWKKQNKLFLQNVKVYEKYAEDTSIDKKVSEAIEKNYKKYFETKIEDTSEKKLDSSFYFVKNFSDSSIKNQYARPTCSAFAGTKGLEILAAQKNESVDLSEHYLYWAAKPDCQQVKCVVQGSWVGFALKRSLESESYDIPMEKDCPYNPVTVKGNQTQIPLKDPCLKDGVLKVEDFLLVKDLSSAIQQLKQDYPFVIGVTLNESFSRNTGLLSYGSDTQSAKDFTKGHAVLAVGYIQLPKSFEEGEYCVVVANSWGVGWGKGGYSCLTEKWLQNYKRINPLVVLRKINIK
ncbi:MAG: C1 family peptidase [Halobacteriovoraceae bacterium]|nr:C1 family peptidase [Halobacteriovoraceae bacterium]MCB9095675.1 C1 family peptidase [Halobacteriovoraceae bacterium]